ncbi:hypothetical protein [Shewanella sp. NIFS-20-20]|uniref:hypothetical protein n=1 Tax=Shewanella sp. NIFS-20-20 TaxID=2853806 RepID=UPI001C47CECE|nr:hypothetical protein [Shewanella sp. NIFS-20-20]MBV7316456.1 hypothetical protein [Shewanella sp. NIFS-20-20]
MFDRVITSANSPIDWPITIINFIAVLNTRSAKALRYRHQNNANSLMIVRALGNLLLQSPTALLFRSSAHVALFRYGQLKRVGLAVMQTKKARYISNGLIS